MKLEIEVSEQDLREFGQQKIEEVMADALKWLRLRRSFDRLSKEIRATWEPSEYEQMLSEIRAEAWQEYKQEIGL